MSDQSYNLIEPFDIDEGELEGVRPVEAFTLGVEWQMVRDQLEAGENFNRPIHTANASRIKRMCIRRGVLFTVAPSVEGWSDLTVTFKEPQP